MKNLQWTTYFFTLTYYILSIVLIDLSTSALALKTLNSKEIKPFPYLSHEKRAKKGKSSGIPLPYLKFHIPLNETYEVNLFEKVELVCETGSFPPATIRWLRNGEDFASMASQSPYSEAMADSEIAAYLSLIKTWGRTAYAINIGGSTSKLTIECVRPEDLGEYTCVAETKFLQEKSKTALTLRKSISQLPEDVGNFYCNKETFLRVPTVFSRTKAVFEIQHHDLQLLCRYSDGEEQVTNWIGPDSEIIPKSSDKYRILDNGDLIIRDLVWEDMGRYKCIKQTATRTAEGTTFVYPVKLSINNED